MTELKTCNHSTLNNNNSCASCPQRKITLFKDLSVEELDFLNSKRYTVAYKKGEVIFKSGTKPIGLICIHSGKVKILRTGPAGNDQIVSLGKEGEMIGLRALIKEEAYSTSAVALDATSVCIIPKELFSKILAKNSSLCINIMSYFIDKLEESEEMHINHAQKHMNGRLADALIMIQNVYGTNPDNGYLNASLKRAELAALANMTTANAIRVLSSFASENIVELQDRDIKLLDIQALQVLSLSGS